MSLKPHLPINLIVQVIEASLPPGRPHSILNPSTPDGRVLVAWTRVCRVTYPFASRLLRKYCAYIDRVDRLERLLRCLAAETAREAPSALPSTLPLSGILAVCLELPKSFTRSVRAWALIKDLFVELGGSVRRVILRTTFSSMYTGSDHIPRANDLLYEGLSELKNLEEFATLRGSYCLSFRRRYAGMLQCWPKLRRLAGCDMDVGEMEFWRGVATTRTLRHVILVSPRIYGNGKLNVKRAVGEIWRRDLDCARRIIIRAMIREGLYPLFAVKFRKEMWLGCMRVTAAG